MIHLGIDLHKQFSFITAMDQQGNVLTKSKVSNQRESFREFLSSYPPSNSQIVLEATWNWYWLWDLLEQQGCRLQMAHPLKTKAIASARIKTDKIDSELLAHLCGKGTLMKIITLRPLVIVVETFYASASQIGRTWGTSPCDGAGN
jgi:transposase